MNAYFASPLTFLVSTLFSLYILLVMLRFLLQLVRADFYNPLSQFIVKVTDPVLHPLRRVIPGWRGLDLASLVLMLLLQVLAVFLVLKLAGHPAAPAMIFVLALAKLVNLAFDVFIYAILIMVILSWVNPGTYNPVSSILHSLTEPVLRPLRNIIPTIGGLDLSPIAAMLGLQVLRMLVMPLFGSLV